MHFSSILLAVASASLAAAAGNTPTGLNYGNMKGNGYEAKVKADYVKEFKAAQALEGTDGKFSSARLYTMIQAGSKDDPNEAIEAAIETKTRLLLGMWTSGPEENFAKELSALNKAIDKYGKKFTDLVDGMSVGSEDLYRISPMGVKNGSDAGIGPDLLVKFIKQVRSAFAGNKNDPVKSIKVGHVDTWTAWTNSSNQAVIDNCDFLGVDAYPYWQSTMSNDIEEAGRLFFEAVKNTEAVAGDAEVWITETGWPVKGKQSNKAIADVKSASKFYEGVGCEIIGKYPTWWYILEENGAPVDFSIADKSFKPLYDLSCKNAGKADKLMKGGDDKDNKDNGDKDSGDDKSSSETASATAGPSGTAGAGGSADSQAAQTASGSAASASSTTDVGNSASARAASGLFALAVAAVAAFMI